MYSVGSRPSDKGGCPVIIQTLRQRGMAVSKKIFFWPFGPHFGLRIRGSLPALDLPLLYRFCYKK